MNLKLLSDSFGMINYLYDKYDKYDKNEFFDPLSVIINLAILSYKQSGTKLSINDNKITIIEKNIYQGFLRSYNGDNKSDLKLLYYSITSACKLFIDKKLYNICENIFIKAINGLYKLIDTYNNDVDLKLCLNNYINIIDNMMTNNNIIDYSSENNIYDIKYKIYDELNSIWDEKRTSIIILLFNELDNKKNDKDLLINSITDFVSSVHINTKSILNQLFINN
jgi:hypothetical protein